MTNALDKRTDEEKVFADAKPRTLSDEAIRRLKRDKLAMFGGIIIILMITLAFLASVISPYDPNTQFNNATTAYGMPLPLNAYSKKVVAIRKDTTKEFTIRSSIVFTDKDGGTIYRTVGNTRLKKGMEKIEFPVSVISLKQEIPKGTVLMIANDSNSSNKQFNDMLNHEFESMTLVNDKHFILGTDSEGRDSLSRLIWGAQVSLKVGVIAVGFSTVVGIIFGLLAGYFGGWVDMAIMRFTDVMMSIPDLLLVMAIVAIKGPSLWIIITSIAVVSWTGIARLVRSQVFIVKEMEYIEAAKACGSKDTPILFYHLLPNVIAPVIVISTMNIAGAIMTEASLSFLGFGVKAPTASWGSMVNEGLGFFRDAAWVPIIPGIAIAVSVFAFNLFGDGVRDAIDPKL